MIYKFSRRLSDGKKTVTLKGTSEQVAKAQAMITEKVVEEEAMQEKLKDSKRPARVKYNQPLFLTSEGHSGESGADLSPRKKADFERLSCSAGIQTMGVFVSAISDPDLFYVQKCGSKSVDLDKLVHEMTAFYDSGTLNSEAYILSEVKTQSSA